MEGVAIDENGPGEVAVFAGVTAGGGFAGGGSRAGGFLGVQTVGGDLRRRCLPNLGLVIAGRAIDGDGSGVGRAWDHNR